MDKQITLSSEQAVRLRMALERDSEWRRQFEAEHGLPGAYDRELTMNDQLAAMLTSTP